MNILPENLVLPSVRFVDEFDIDDGINHVHYNFLMIKGLKFTFSELLSLNRRNFSANVPISAKQKLVDYTTTLLADTAYT